MNSLDLRLGNLFYPIDRSKQIHLPVPIPEKVYSINLFSIESVSADKPFFFQTKINKFNIEDITGIPINEKWLVNFGFESVSKTFIYQKVTTQLNNKIKIHRVQENFYCLGGYEGSCNKIQYIHQLQNLYFYVTGEDLTLKSVLQE